MSMRRLVRHHCVFMAVSYLEAAPMRCNGANPRFLFRFVITRLHQRMDFQCRHSLNRGYSNVGPGNLLPLPIPVKNQGNNICHARRRNSRFWRISR